MIEKKLSDFGLVTVEEAAAARGWAVRTVQRWIADDLLPAVAVGEGRNRKHLLAAADVDAFTPPARGAPVGNQNAAKKKPASRPRPKR